MTETYALMQMYGRWCKERKLAEDRESVLLFMYEMNWLNVEKIREDIDHEIQASLGS